MSFWQNFGAQLGLLFTLLISGATVYKLYLKKWLAKRKAAKDAKEQAKWDALINQMKILDTLVKEIRAEVKPNGGGSMNDKQLKMGKQMDELILSINGLKIGQRNFCDIMEIASWESDKKGRFTYVSVSLCELMNAQIRDLLGNSWIGTVAYFDRDKVKKAWHEAVDNASEFTVPFSIELTPGVYLKVIPSVIHNKDKEGKVLNSVGRLQKIGEPYTKK